MSLVQRLLTLCRRRPSVVPAMPSRSVLVPTPPIASPLPPVHPDLALIYQHYDQHRKNFPGLSFPEFLQQLEERHRFCAEERIEREQKLRRLLQTPRFTP